MTVSEAEVSTDSKRLLDAVIEQGRTIDIQRGGQTVARISPAAGVSRKELVQLLSEISWTKEESDELRSSMEVSSVIGYAGRD